MSTRISPLPEAIDGRPWKIEEGLGSCDTVGRVMAVPTDDRADSRFVRNHEIAHAKITPRVAAYKQCEKFDVSMDAMQACEDLRVHMYLSRTGVDMCGCFLGEDDAENFVRRWADDDRRLALHLVAAMHTDDHERLSRAIENRLDECRVAYLRAMTEVVAGRMAYGRGLDRPIGFRNGTIPAARLLDSIFPPDGSPSRLPPEATKLPLRGGKTVRWGEMRIMKLPMASSRGIPAAVRARGFHDHGAVLGAVHRFASDGRIFTRKKRQVGGTVLVDASGSMGFSKADIEKIVRTAPLATVAVYAGRQRNGVLMIVASKGRMVSRVMLRMVASLRGNIVDGPALRWLARQPGPRFWISDGLVTGVSDRQSVDLVVDVTRICGKAAITRVDTVDDLCRHLKSSMKNGKTPLEKAR